MLAPITPAIYLGAMLAGLAPGYWFDHKQEPTPRPLDFTPEKGAPIFADGGIARLLMLGAVLLAIFGLGLILR